MASRLRLEYQRSFGRKVCDRTWQRVKKRLNIKDEDDTSLMSQVKAYGELRKRNPYKAIRIADVNRYRFFLDNLPKLVCKGDELRLALQRLKPNPSVATIYRWGQEIKCPFSVDRVYTSYEIQKWVIKIVSQTKFSFPENQNIRS